MATTDTDVATIEHLDFDVPLACELKACDKAARWVMRTVCCGASWLICEPHRLDCVERWNTSGVKAMGAICTECAVIKRHWRDLVEFIPIEAR